MMLLNLAKNFSAGVSLVLFYTTNATDILTKLNTGPTLLMTITGKIWSAQTVENIICTDHISKIRVHPKSYHKLLNPHCHNSFCWKNWKVFDPRVPEKYIYFFVFSWAEAILLPTTFYSCNPFTIECVWLVNFSDILKTWLLLFCDWSISKMY